MAIQEYRHDVTVLSVSRKGTSTNGNPTFAIVTDKGVYRTETDASIGYAMGNYTMPNFPDEYVIDQPVTLITTKAGRVWAIEKNGKRL